jgi:hypothetical protein
MFFTSGTLLSIFYIRKNNLSYCWLIPIFLLFLLIIFKFDKNEVYIKYIPNYKKLKSYV